MDHFCGQNDRKKDCTQYAYEFRFLCFYKMKDETEIISMQTEKKTWEKNEEKT